MKSFNIKKLIHFSSIGAVGFVVDATIMYLLKNFIGLYPAKLASFFCAVLVTWLLNRILTFRHQPSGLKATREFIRYFSLMVFGGIMNYGAFWLSTYSFPIIYEHPILGVAIGSLAGLAFNYFSANFFIFKKTSNLDKTLL